MRLSPLGFTVFIAFCVLLFSTIVTMPEPMFYSFVVAPMVVPRSKELMAKVAWLLSEPEQAPKQEESVEGTPIES